MKLKRIILISFLMLLSETYTINAANYSEYISSVEQNLFDTQFQNENIEKRLDRIEKDVFGKTSNLSINQRIENLQKIYKDKTCPYLKVANKTTPPASDSQSYLAPITINKTSQANPEQILNYPVIDQIETKIFNKTFANEDIYKRIERLEIVIFKRNFNEDLSTRVDRLKATVIGIPQNADQDEDNQNYPPATSSFMDKNSLNTILGKLETETFKTTYPNDQTEARLDRLETKIFSQTSPEDSVENRVERLSSVIAAQPTSDLYKDVSKLNQYQNLSNQLSVATIILLLLKGLLL